MTGPWRSLQCVKQVRGRRPDMSSSSPRSVYIAFEAFPRPKGASSHIASMVSALSRRHAPVWVLCCGYGDMPARQVEGDLVIWRHKAYHPNMLRRAAEFADFVAAMLDSADGGIEVCMFRDPWGGCAALQASLDSTTVFEVNALPSLELPYAYPAVRRNYALRAKVESMERFCLSACDHIVTVSPVTRAALIRLGTPREKITALPNAASETFQEASAEDCSLPELADGEWFGYVGSLQAWQGVETAVDAFAVIADDLPDARMLVVHNGRRQPLRLLRKRIRKRNLSERVRLQQPLPPERLAPVLAKLRFTVAPLTETARNTVQGCCPIKIVESMAAGTPVVASDIRACRYLLTHEKDALLVRPDDRRAWALAMRRMFKEPGLAAGLADRARQIARKRFTWPVVHAKLERCFDSASANGSYLGG